jgi:hypothetical protein
MSEATAPEYSEWLTIAEAAEVLGVSERQARRYAKRLPDGDRREPDTTPDMRPDMTTGATVTQVRRASIIEAYREATGRKVERETTDTMTGARPAQAGHEAGHHDRRDDEQQTRDREEIAFLRGLIEQRDRDAAELRAALRVALKTMPKQLEAGSGSTPIEGREDARQTSQSVEVAQPTGKGASVAPRRPQRTAWQRVAARILGIR